MSLNMKVGVLAGAASAMVAGVCYGGSTPGDTDARIAALEAQIAQLKNESSSWVNAEQTRALIRETQADSEARSSLLRDGGTAGYREGRGFFLSNEDGSFDVNIGLKSQFRGIYNDKQAADSSTFGWEATRTRISFDGHAGNPDLTYMISGEFDSSGAFGLLDAYGNWGLGNGWDWGWGQITAPFLHEDMVDEFQQLAIERSYVDAVFGIGRTQGTWLHYATDTIDFWLSFNDGGTITPGGLNAGNLNTPWTADGTDWAFTARVQAVLAGNNKAQFNDYTSWSNDETGFLLGAAIHWQDGEYGTGAEEVKSFSWTVDASAEFGAANVAAYVVGLSTDPNSSAATSYDQFGFVLQGGYHLVPDKFEIFGRWEWMDLDNAVANDNLNILTFGCNYYFGRHQGWKWSTDLVYALDAVPASSSNVGLLADALNDSDQWAIRSQMQVSIP